MKSTTPVSTAKMNGGERTEPGPRGRYSRSRTKMILWRRITLGAKRENSSRSKCKLCPRNPQKPPGSFSRPFFTPHPHRPLGNFMLDPNHVDPALRGSTAVALCEGQSCESDRHRTLRVLREGLYVETTLLDPVFRAHGATAMSRVLRNA
jgi:hypothetical protein